MNLRRVPELVPTLLLVAALVPRGATALPEDAQQEIEVDSEAAELFLDEGLIVYTGSESEPACITQGTLKICGNEIRLERAPGAEAGLQKVTATGTPATFQQQPAADQQLAHASGGTLVFDNVTRLVTADGDAEFSQAGTVLTHQHIEYNLDTRRASASSSGERGQMRIPPNAAN
ncbi:MAG TPA: lipopolysaccharide transport periplasmic protein LptA [Pseudomonadales bacterium]